MTSMLRDIQQTLQRRFGAGQESYQGNLLGESLQELLRKATAKTQDGPDEHLNQQVGSRSRSPPSHSDG